VKRYERSFAEKATKLVVATPKWLMPQQFDNNPCNINILRKNPRRRNCKKDFEGIIF
jgi:hypothetical protein